MNRKLPALVALVLIALPTVVTALDFSFVEDFSDDTVGANPTGDYSYFESTSAPAVTASGKVGNGLSVPGATYVGFQPTGTDFCQSGTTLEMWFKPTYGGAVVRESFIGVGAEDPNGVDVRDIDDEGLLGFQIRADFGSSWAARAVAYGATGAEITTISASEPYGVWYKVVIDQINCGSKSVRVALYDASEVLIGQVTETCGTCTGFGSVFDTVAIGSESNVASSIILVVDEINGGEPVPPAPPAGLTGEVQALGGPTTDGKVELIFPLSVDDPDQDNGTLTYKIYDQVGFVSDVTWFPGDGFGRYNYTYTGSGPFGDFTFHVTAVDTGVESADSCTVTLNLDTLGDAGACGNSGEVPAAPNGLNALVQVAVTATQGTVELRFPLSSNDPDQDTGLFTYTPYVDALVGFADTIDADDGDGFRKATISLTDPSPGEVQFRVKATNTTNGLSSSFSCSVFIDVSQRFNVGNCGTMPLPGTPAGVGGGPLFDIQPLVDASGASASAIGWVAGIVITIGLAFGGVFYFGPLGGLAGGALGIGFATAVGWFPLWFIVFVVLLLAGAFVAFRGQ